MFKKMNMAILLAAIMPGLCYAEAIERQFSASPSKLSTAMGGAGPKVKLYTPISCYSIYSGALLDCAYTFQLTGLKGDSNDVDVNGGHSHNPDTHPQGTITSNDGVASDGKIISGQTSESVVTVTHTLPETAGKIGVQVDIAVPPGWFCVSQCFDATRKGWRVITTIDIGVQNLTSLPDPSPDDKYVKIRSNPDPLHTDDVAYYGTTKTVAYLRALAVLYNVLSSGKTLSVNDMSLPKGGLFDINGNWKPSHNLHRIGTSSDINRADGGDCVHNKTLKEAADLLMPPLTKTEMIAGLIPVLVPDAKSLPSSFRCESGALQGNTHIDYDMAAPLQGE